MIKAGTNKIILEEVKIEKNDSLIEIPENLRERIYKVVNVGTPRSTYDLPPTVSVGDSVKTALQSGTQLKVDGKNYTVVNYDEIMIIL